jgi:peroxiredoxin
MMKNLKILSLFAFVVVSSAFAFNSLTGNSKPNADSIKGYNIGDAATDFSLKSTQVKMVSLNDFKKAKGFILIFTTNHCPYSKAYQKRIIALDQKFKTKGYPVIGINPNDSKDYPEDSFENMKIRSRQEGFTFPYLMDKAQKIYPQYGATKTPHVYILKKEKGQNIVKYIGAIDDNYQNAKAVDKKFVENAVDALLKGKEIALKTTKAIGCSIK